MPPFLHPRVVEVTERIRERSWAERDDYLARMAAAGSDKAPTRTRLSCTNLAHGFASAESADKAAIRQLRWPNLAIINSYNDMLSAHQPLERYPVILRAAAREAGATAQVAGGVPAMCDGITQGMPGMELSLFSRDVIAMATGVSLAHGMFDATLCLGVCDKIVPGLLIGALAFGHLPTIFVPGGPMPSGMPNKDKARIRKLFAEGKVEREALLESEAGSYHSAGTCTFYGTANSNQMLMEVMGLHLPGSAFIPPNTPLRDALTAFAARRAAQITALGNDYRPLARVVDERAMVNAVVGLLATGGSTNHTLHLIAIARAAGLILDWEDFDQLSRGGAAAGADLSEWRRRRESLPCRGRHGFPGARTAGCGTHACGCAHRCGRGAAQLCAGTVAVAAGSGLARCTRTSAATPRCCGRRATPSARTVA